MKFPEYKLVDKNDIEATFELDIQEELECFDGHFDGHPVLPGVAQVTFAVQIAEKHFSLEPHFKGLEVVKFQNVITPPNIISLLLKHDQAKSKLYFKFYKQDKVYSSGRVLV